MLSAKKLFLVPFLALAAGFSLGIAAWAQASFTDQAAAYIQYQDTWLPKTQLPEETRFTAADLDRDGKIELIVDAALAEGTYVDGYLRRTTKIYRLNEQNKPVPYDSDVTGYPLLQWQPGQAVTVYPELSTYIVHRLQEGEWMQDDLVSLTIDKPSQTLRATVLGSRCWNIMEGNDGMSQMKYFDWNDREIDQESYEQLLHAGIFAGSPARTVQFHWLPQQEELTFTQWQGLSKLEQTDYLMETAHYFEDSWQEDAKG